MSATGNQTSSSAAGRLLRLAAVAFATILLAAGAFTAWTVSLGPLPLAQAREVSTTIVDRNGKLLRAYAMADGRWRCPSMRERTSIPVISNCC